MEASTPVPLSPAASMRTNPSASNPLNPQPPYHQSSFPFFPAQAARLNPSFSANDLTMFSTASVGSRDAATAPTSQPSMPILGRTSSVVFSQGGASTTPGHSYRGMEMSGSAIPPLTLDGSEPRIFPGVVSRARKSITQRPSSGQFSDAEINAAKNNLALGDPALSASQAPEDGSQK